MFIALAMSFKQWLLAASCLTDPHRLALKATPPKMLIKLKRDEAARAQQRIVRNAPA